MSNKITRKPIDITSMNSFKVYLTPPPITMTTENVKSVLGNIFPWKRLSSTEINGEVLLRNQFILYAGDRLEFIFDKYCNCSGQILLAKGCQCGGE